MDFGALAQELLSRSESCVREWLPDGKKRGHEWVVGGLGGESGGSLSINLNSGNGPTLPPATKAAISFHCMLLFKA